MTRNGESETKTESKDRNVGCGCASNWLVVAIIGLGLLAADKSVSIGGTVGIPFTDVNFTIAGSIGAKYKLEQPLPEYLQGRTGLRLQDDAIFNHNQVLAIGPVAAEDVVVLGKQAGAPGLGLILGIK